MRKAFVAFFVILLLLPLFVYSQQLPKPVSYISDFAGVVDADLESAINQFSQTVEKNTSSQIFVATVEDTSPYTSKEYATKLFDSWKPGQKGKDNGIIVLLAFRPDRRVEIETGYGVEGILPDSKVARIAREFSPLLTEGKYAEGLYKIVQAVGGVIQGSGEFEATGESGGGLDLGVIIFFAIIIIFVFVAVSGTWSAPKCPKCNIRMQKIDGEVVGDYIIEEFVCKQCGKRIKKKKERSRYYGFVLVGGSGGWGGGSGGGFGGGGGGGSGGGGGGSGF